MLLKPEQMIKINLLSVIERWKKFKGKSVHGGEE